MIQVLNNSDLPSLEAHLNRLRVGVAFDDLALKHKNGAFTLEFATNLLARLYPHLRFIYQGHDRQGYLVAEQLVALAKEINPQIEASRSEEPLDHVLCVGWPAIDTGQPVWVWSDSWNISVSSKRPTVCPPGGSQNPISAAAAACFGAAELFADIFSLSSPAGDHGCFTLSLLDYQHPPSPSIPLPPVHLEDLVLAGVGAVGNAVVWCLSHLDHLTGTMSLVDPEKVDLSNLQRYVLTDCRSVEAVKVELAQRTLLRDGLDVRVYPERFGDFVQKYRPACDFNVIATAVDNSSDRVAAQAVLPALVLNGWTGEAGSLGVSRHRFDEKQACLACLYLAHGQQKNRTDEIAERVGLPAKRVAEMLVNRIPLDRHALAEISNTKGYPFDILLQWDGHTLDHFYVEAVCGGALLKVGVSGGQTKDTLVPLVHQSALAGVMLAGEVVKHALGLVPEDAPVEARVNVLQAVPHHVAMRRGKTTSPPCICQDTDYLRVYRAKHAL